MFDYKLVKCYKHEPSRLVRSLLIQAQRCAAEHALLMLETLLMFKLTQKTKLITASLSLALTFGGVGCQKSSSNESGEYPFPELVQEISLEGKPVALTAAGNRVLVNLGSTLNVMDTSSYEILKRLKTEASSSILIRDRFAIQAHRGLGFSLVNLQSDASPLLNMATSETQDGYLSPSHIFSRNGAASLLGGQHFVGSTEYGLASITITDPTSIVLNWRSATHDLQNIGHVTGGFVRGQEAYLLDYDQGIHRFALSADGSTPGKWLSVTPLSKKNFKLLETEFGILIASKTLGLVLLEEGTEGQMTIATSLPTPNVLVDVATSLDRIYAIERDPFGKWSLSTYQWPNQGEAIKLIGRKSAPDESVLITANKDSVYVATGTGGLFFISIARSMMG